MWWRFSLYRDFIQKIYDNLVLLHHISDQDAVESLDAYRDVFTRLDLDKVDPAELSLIIKDNPGKIGAVTYGEYLDSLDAVFGSLAESKKLPYTGAKNKPAEICPSCKMFKYVQEPCTFCGSSEKGLRVT